MYCRNCGNELQEGQKFCPKCGAPVPGAKTGTNTSPGSEGMNGNNAGQQVPDNNANVSASGATSPKKNNTRMIIAIAVAVVIVIVVIIAVIATRSGRSAEQEPEEATEEKEIVAEIEEKEEVEEAEDETETPGLVDNIVLNLSVSEGYSYPTIKDSITDNSFDLILVSGTITNNNDENCAVVLQYDMEVTSLDNYGDPQTESQEINSDSIYIAAHDTIPFNQYICDVIGGYMKPNGSFDESRADGNTTYACKSVTVDAERTKATDLSSEILPVSAVTDVQKSYSGDNGNVLVTFTVPNNTDDRWKKVNVDYDVFLEGQYIMSDTASADYIKPGETAEVLDTFYNASNWGFYSSYDVEKYNEDSFLNASDIVVTGVTYTIDTDEYDD